MLEWDSTETPPLSSHEPPLNPPWVVVFLHHLDLYHSLGIFSRRQIDIFFLIFPRKQDLTFHTNCLHWSNLPEISNLVSWKNEKNIPMCRLLKILPRVLSVKKSVIIKGTSHRQYCRKHIYISLCKRLKRYRTVFFMSLWYVTLQKA